MRRRWVSRDLAYARRRIVGYVAIAVVASLWGWAAVQLPALLGSVVELGEWQDPSWR